MPSIGHNSRVMGVDAFTREQADSRFLLPRRNLLINGGFDIWQRGTSFATNGFAADRWRISGNVTLPSLSVDRATNPLKNHRYAMRKSGATTSFTTGSEVQVDAQKIENPQRLHNVPVTLSVTLESDVARSVNIGGRIVHATGEVYTQYQQVQIPAGVTECIVTIPAQDMAELELNDTSYYDVEMVWAVGSTVAAQERLAGQGTLNWGGGYVTYCQAQLEIGSIATPFEHRHIADELALCQRYFYSHDRNTTLWSGAAYAGRAYYLPHTFPVPMRVPPTISIQESGSSGAFSTTVKGTPIISSYGFYEARDAVTTSESTYFRSVYTADAEI